MCYNIGNMGIRTLTGIELGTVPTRTARVHGVPRVVCADRRSRTPFSGFLRRPAVFSSKPEAIDVMTRGNPVVILDADDLSSWDDRNRNGRCQGVSRIAIK